MSAIWLVVKELLTSKKFLVFVSGVIVTLLARLKLNIDPATVQEMVGLIIAYLVGQGIADHGKEAAKVNGTVALAGGNEPEQPVKDKLI